MIIYKSHRWLYDACFHFIFLKPDVYCMELLLQGASNSLWNKEWGKLTKSKAMSGTNSGTQNIYWINEWMMFTSESLDWIQCLNKSVSQPESHSLSKWTEINGKIFWEIDLERQSDLSKMTQKFSGSTPTLCTPTLQFPTFAVLWYPTGSVYSSSLQDCLRPAGATLLTGAKSQQYIPLGQAALHCWLPGTGVWKPGSPALDWRDFELEHPRQSSPAGSGGCFLLWDSDSVGPMFGFLLFPFLLPYSLLVPPGSKPFLNKSFVWFNLYKKNSVALS